MGSPIWIRHRINSIADLASVDRNHGVEIDLRSCVQKPKSIHLSHDPWVQGDDFESWAREFKARGIHGPIILNTKEDGLETRAMEILQSQQISHFFFLDTALPTLVKWTLHQGERRFAVRLSRHEPLESIAAFRGKADWVWVDCFEGNPLSEKLVELAKKDFKVCLVSPELQGMPTQSIHAFKTLSPLADAICTKSVETWTTL